MNCPKTVTIALLTGCLTHAAAHGGDLGEIQRPARDGVTIEPARGLSLGDQGNGRMKRDEDEATVPLWGRFETQVVNPQDYTNPFKDVVLNATFTGPSGKSIPFIGYFDGDGRGGQTGSIWRLRFMPDDVGRWTYTCRFSDGAADASGEFTCVAEGANPGPVHADGRWLKFANGRRFYPRSYYLSEAFSGASPHWEQTIERFFGGTYKYNFCCTTFWQGRLLDRNRWNNLPYNGFHPIRDKDYTRLDLASWRHVDEVLQRLESRRAVWYNFDGFVPNVGGGMPRDQRSDFAAQQVYIRNVVARLAPYWNVTWNIAFEWREFMNPDEVRRLVDYTKSIDPWHHPVGAHDQRGFRSGKEVVGALNVDFVTLQYDAGKCGDAVTASQFVQKYDGGVPVYAQEVCWEADSKLNGDQIRKGAWGVVLAGGILNYAEMFDGPNKGRPENYGDGKALPHLEIMFDFIDGLPYWDMSPQNELVSKDCLCFAQPASRYVCYSPAGQSIQLDLSGVSGRFAAAWLNPRTGKVTMAPTVDGGEKRGFACPDRNDWVFHLSRRQR